jgi:hypothetical protein
MINSVLNEVSSIGYPQAGKNGIGNTIRIQIVPSRRSSFHLSLSLERSSIAFICISIIKHKLFLVQIFKLVKGYSKDDYIEEVLLIEFLSCISLRNLTFLFIFLAILMPVEMKTK